MIAGSVAGLAVVSFLAFGVFGLHTLFIDDVVAEEAPTFESAPPATTAGTETTDSVGSGSGSESPEPVDGAGADTAEPVTAATGAFVDGDHPTSGTANVLTDGGTQRVLRLEDDFATDNGPDLNVYLATGADVDGAFVDLGDLKGNIGSQNYTIPEDVDLSELDTVVIWCVRFGVDFGSAPLVGS